MDRVDFWQGKREKYDIQKHSNGIYFAADTHEVLLNGVSYGLSSSDLTVLQGSIKRINYIPPVGDDPGKMVVTRNNGEIYEKSLSTIISDSTISIFADMDGNYNISVKLKDTKNVDGISPNLIKQTETGITAEAFLYWDQEKGKLMLKNMDGITVSEINTAPFTKDSTLSNVKVKNVSDDNGKVEKCLVFTWNTDAGKQPVHIPVTDIFNPYTVTGGLIYDSETNSIRIQIKPNEKYIKVENGQLQTTDEIARMDNNIQQLNIDVKNIEQIISWNDID